MDSPALFVLGRILQVGARKYGVNNWRKIDIDDHLNSAVMHIYAYWGGDKSDDHLGHAFCRLMFALAVALEQGYDADVGSVREDPAEDSIRTNPSGYDPS